MCNMNVGCIQRSLKHTLPSTNAQIAQANILTYQHREFVEQERGPALLVMLVTMDAGRAVQLVALEYAWADV